MNFANPITVSMTALLFISICIYALRISLGNAHQLPSTYFPNNESSADEVNTWKSNIDHHGILSTTNTARDPDEDGLTKSCPDTESYKMATIKFAAALVADGQFDDIVLDGISSMDTRVHETVFSGIVKETFNNTLSKTERIIQFLSKSEFPCSVYLSAISTLLSQMNKNGYESSMEILLLESTLNEGCKDLENSEMLRNVTSQVMRQKDKILQSFAENIGNITSLPHEFAMGRVYKLFSKSDQMSKYIPDIVSRAYAAGENGNITQFMSLLSFIAWLPSTNQKVMGYHALVDTMKANGQLQSKESMLMAFYVGSDMKYSAHEFDYNYHDPRNIFKDVLERVPVEFKNLVWPTRKCEMRNSRLNKTLVPSISYSEDILSTPVILVDDLTNTLEVVSWELNLEFGNLVANIRMGGDGIYKFWSLCGSIDGVQDNVTACKPPNTWTGRDMFTWRIEPVVISRDADVASRDEIVFTVARFNEGAGPFYLYAREAVNDENVGMQNEIGTRSKENLDNMEDLYWKLECKD